MRQGNPVALQIAALWLAASVPCVAAIPVPRPALRDQVGPELIEMTYRGVSPPVRALPSVDEAGLRPWLGEVATRIEGEGSPFDEHGVRFGAGTLKVDDPLVDLTAADGRSASPDPGLNFDGLSSVIQEGPPDPEGAVGPDHYVQFVNIQFRVFDKHGVPLTEPVATNSLWAGSGSLCEGDLYADPVVMYDEAADRWVVAYIVFDIGPGWDACIAVSTGEDPTGTYYLYELEAPRIPDYPKLGVWPDPIHNAFVMSTIPIPDPQGKHDVYVLDRERLLQGLEPRPAQRFVGFPNFLMPADIDGPRAAPAGSPVPLYTFRDGGESFFIPPTPVDSLDLYELSVDWDEPASSRLVLSQSFTPPDLAEFNWTICGWNNPDCLPQPSTDQKLDSISWIPMQRLQYRNFGDHETLVGVWTVNAVAEGEHAAPRWFELRRYENGPWQLAFQGTFAPSPSHRWMASVALDRQGNMAMGYSVVDTDLGIFPSLRYAVRPVDSQDFLGERTLVEGTGFLVGSNRWGDYASMEVDPSDGCTFWFTGEYVATTGVATWSTRIGSFRVPGCANPTPAPTEPPVALPD